jgi:hypothetical protein
MNPLNYISLEVAKKLVEAEIVVPSEFWWEDHAGTGKWEIHNIVFIRNLWGDPVANGRYYPAPSPAELWREFKNFQVHVMQDIYVVVAWIEWTVDSFLKSSPAFKNTCLADALAELLIWVRGEKK